MHTYLSGGNLHKYDSATLLSELDKDRMRKKKAAEEELIKKRNNGKIEEHYKDYLIKLNSDIPLEFIRPLQDKFCIKYDEMTSKPQYHDPLNDKKIAEEVGKYG
jgi:hypothetical protein